jgi:hypothetical protein
VARAKVDKVVKFLRFMAILPYSTASMTLDALTTA